MFRLKDRNGRDMCLGMTHEEVVTWLAAREIRSLPRPAADLVPDPDQGARRGAAQARRPAHARVRHEGLLQPRPRRGGLRDAPTTPTRRPTTASTSAAASLRGGRARPGHDGRPGSHEFMAPSGRRGRDRLLRRVRLRGQRRAGPRRADAGRRSPRRRAEEVATPGARTIAEVVGPAQDRCRRAPVKSLVVMGARRGPVLALVRGDHELHELKLAARSGGLPPGPPDEVRRPRAWRPGFVGPVGAHAAAGLRRRVAARRRLRRRRQQGRLPPARRDARAGSAGQFADLREAAPGDPCPQCGTPLAGARVIEVGNIFQLGTKYSVPLGATYLDEDGKERPHRHGQLRHRPGAHRRRGRRAAPRRRRHLLAGRSRRSRCTWSWWPSRMPRRWPAADEIYGISGRPASTCSWTTGTSGPG